jgi:cell division protein FtsI/penicillin-binding protein 2
LEIQGLGFKILKIAGFVLGMPIFVLGKKLKSRQKRKDDRLVFLKYGTIFWSLLIICRLFVLQILDFNFYSALALDQREILTKLFPERGQIFVQDKEGNLYPLATNEDRFLVYADTRLIKEPNTTAELLAKALGKTPEEIKKRLEKENDPFEPIERGVSEEKMEEIKKMNLSGINFLKESYRFYPFNNIGSHLVGFVGEDESGKRKGRYGLEGYFDQKLAGEEGSFEGEYGASGSFIPWGIKKFQEAKDGYDLILTIDRNIQYIACRKLNEAVQRHGADGGSVVIMEPKTGRILAMCGAPDFDPNNYYQVKNPAVFNNPVIFNQYEPGSVFKVITMAAALDTGVITPETAYEDKGQIKIGSRTIANFDGKARGLQTMTQALEQSLNTGAVFAAFRVGLENFRRYVEAFGFGKPTGIELGSEAKGNISSLFEKNNNPIYLATASFGQGIAVTPLQLVVALGAIANEGKLMKPFLVEKIKDKETIIFENYPQVVRQVISPKTATLLSGMMVRAVENGHGKKAGVPGYYVAGKTGTAQIPRPGIGGYEPDMTIGTFAGFAPVEDPRFVMVVRIDRPRDVKFAESSAAPLFGEIAQFVLNYLEVKPTRPREK